MRKSISIKTSMLFLIFLSSLFLTSLPAQNDMGNHRLRINLNQDKTHWLSFTTFIQFWARVNHNNPGTNVLSDDDPYTADLSIRRFRFAAFSQVSDRLFLFLQLGKNNLSYLSPRGTSLDLLDAYAEYTFSKKFALGAGKSSWDGLSRYTAPNSAKQLTSDLPFVALPTLDATDDLIRKLSVFAKGKISNFDYRLILSKPFSTQNSGSFQADPIADVARFTDSQVRPQYAGYIKYEFWEKESNLTSTALGTYHGKKKVMNLGGGFIFQPDALWSLHETDTVYHHLALFALDFFMELPLHTKRRTAVTLYTALFNYNFGPNYIRLLGANNPGYAINTTIASFNGRGNAFPVSGTGNSWLTQAGYLFPKMGTDGKWGHLQPYTMIQFSEFEGLKDRVFYFDVGCNWLFQNHLSKLSLNLQNRPIFIDEGNGPEQQKRRLQYVVQYQVRIE